MGGYKDGDAISGYGQGMTASPQEPTGSRPPDPDIDPAGPPPVTDPDTVSRGTDPVTSDPDPLTADPGTPSAPPP